MIIGRFLAMGHLGSLAGNWEVVKRYVYTGFLCKRFRALGAHSTITYPADKLSGEKFVSIGKQTILGKHIRLMAISDFKGTHFQPSIQIGDFCCIRDGATLSAIGQMIIGNHVLTGTNVLISDNAHGKTTTESMRQPPVARTLYSKGPIVIGDNVWIGNNACILGGVTIGEGCIIAANAVVTHNVPPYCVAAGVPAKIVKVIKSYS